MAHPKPRVQAQPADRDRNNSDSNDAAAPVPKGPHPGYVSSAQQYTFEHQIRRLQVVNRSDPAREDNYRLQGVQLIDSIRQLLQL